LLKQIDAFQLFLKMFGNCTIGLGQLRFSTNAAAY